MTTRAEALAEERERDIEYFRRTYVPRVVAQVDPTALLVHEPIERRHKMPYIKDFAGARCPECNGEIAYAGEWTLRKGYVAFRCTGWHGLIVTHGLVIRVPELDHPDVRE